MDGQTSRLIPCLFLVTPSDYEPPGFEVYYVKYLYSSEHCLSKATSDDEFHFKEEPLNIRVGDVTTVSQCLNL